jgi:hypothetical protein
MLTTLCFPRSIYNSAVWYYHHCEDRMPIVMVTEDEEAIQKYGSETEGVFVISFKVFPVARVCTHTCRWTHTHTQPFSLDPLATQKRESRFHTCNPNTRGAEAGDLLKV